MRRWLTGAALLVLAAIVGAIAVAAIYLPSASERIRQRVIADLSRDLDSEVDVESLQWRLRPSPGVALHGLVMRHKGRHDVPPLIQVGSLTAEVSLSGWMAHRLDRVSIEGLRIFIPPRNRGGAPPADTGRTHGNTPERPRAAAGPASGWFIDRLMATDATLFLAVREPGHRPREFHIHRLAMSAVGANRVMAFQAALTNPRPAGEIETTGTFGPWQQDEPSLTPLQATYAFSHADLATFKGIGGILTSEGAFGGILERIEANGSTTTPDFRLSLSGNPVPLATHFEAVIDGTNGNTVLTSVVATLGQSRLVVSGAVIGKPGIDGRTITIDATIPNGRLDDVLRLAVKGKTTPLTGDIEVKARILLPPGDRDVADKLQLDGTFRVKAGRFTSLAIQKALGGLSKRGRGKPEEEGGPSPVSNMAGRFTLRDTVMTLPELTFGVPGATILLSGRYHLRQETLAFLGTVRLQARASHTMTGTKRLFLRPIDPLFARDGAGTVLPIHIAGTRDHPVFSVDVKSTLLRRGPR